MLSFICQKNYFNKFLSNYISNYFEVFLTKVLSGSFIFFSLLCVTEMRKKERNFASSQFAVNSQSIS